ncbi:hypothetical protein CIK88_02180 [Prevotella sp. P5-50]|nr:hypothetical protein CIK88_02180 [Prevotella sp. P5-50]
MHIPNLRPVRTKVETLLAPNKIFNENLKQNALEYLAFGKNFYRDRIGDARNLNENLKNNL